MSERERIARELREHAEKQGDPSGWLGAIAEAIETEWAALNGPDNFKNEPCRFAVMQERDALQARCDELEAAARDACEQLKSLAYASHKATGRPLSKRPRTKLLQRPEKVRDNLLAVRKALRSVVDGGE